MAAVCLLSQCSVCGCAGGAAIMVEDYRSVPLSSPLCRDTAP